MEERSNTPSRKLENLEKQLLTKLKRWQSNI